MLEENYCFDAEMYADEIQLEEAIDFREDQRSKPPESSSIIFQLHSLMQRPIMLSVFLCLHRGPCSKLGEVGSALSIFRPYR